MATIPKGVNLKRVILACHHEAIIGHAVAVPEPGDEYWCPKHQVMTTVYRILSLEEQYIVLCRNCPHSRNKGIAKLNAEMGATRHSQLHPGHIVDVVDGNGEVIQTSSRDSPQETLDF